MSIVERRFSGSFTPSPVATANGAFLPLFKRANTICGSASSRISAGTVQLNASNVAIGAVIIIAGVWFVRSRLKALREDAP